MERQKKIIVGSNVTKLLVWRHRKVACERRPDGESSESGWDGEAESESAFERWGGKEETNQEKEFGSHPKKSS